MNRWRFVSALRRLALPAALSCVVLLLLLQAVNLSGFREVLQSADVTLLFIATLKVPANYLILAVRWRLLLTGGGFNVSHRSLWLAVMVGCFFNNVTPGLKVGGDPLKAYYLSRQYNVGFKPLMAGIAAERTLQGVTLVITAAIALLMSVIIRLPLSSIRAFAWLTIVTTALVGISLYIVVHRAEELIRAAARLFKPFRLAPRGGSAAALKKLSSEVRVFHREYAALLRDTRVVVAVIGLTLLQLALAFTHAYLIFRALHVDIPIIYVILGTTAVQVAGIVAITPGGAGIAEGVNFGVYTILRSIPGEAIAAQTLLSRALDTWLIWITSGIVTAFATPELVRSVGKGPRQ